MSIHSLRQIVVGVPNVDKTSIFYHDFGLGDGGSGNFTTSDGGQQLQLVSSPRRRLISLSLSADDMDDIARIASRLTAAGFSFNASAEAIEALEPGTGVMVEVCVADRLSVGPGHPHPKVNYPGWPERLEARADGVLRNDRVMPRKLGHVVVGSTDQDRSMAFFAGGIGFKVSDQVAGEAAFLRCTTDHHNLLVQRAPVQFLHHTSWQVDDVEEVGRGATRMLEADPNRHVWGLGRHRIGSNFFWYLRDPAGNFTEYYSDMDCIVDDAMWKPEVFTGRDSLYAWGPEPPASFLHPEDLAELMVGMHGSR